MLKENSLRDSAPLFVSCSNLMKQKAKEERRGALQHPGGYSHGKQAHVGLSNSALPAAAACTNQALLAQLHLGMENQQV